MNDFGLAVMLVLAYLIGATPTSYIAGKLGKGIDLREHGSNNLGATNVYRVLGWKYAIPVGVIDMVKGAVPVVILGPWSNGPAWFTVAVLFPLWVRVTAPEQPYTFWAGVVLALLIVYTHRHNIARLRGGTENRFRTRKGLAA